MNISAMQKVLIADDDAINRQVLGELLKPEYMVLLAKNGEQTLERAARHLPDLILLDVMMPDMDGYEVLRRLRADPQTAHIAVIFISGLDRPEDEANGLNLGAADYIAKPFNATVVTARVALHLQVVRQRRMLERLAHIDGLTELANRRRFDEVYAIEWQRARGAPPAVAGFARHRLLQAVQRPLRPSGEATACCARWRGPPPRSCGARSTWPRATAAKNWCCSCPTPSANRANSW
ncbi:response regulator [Massilia sp. H-1]|nr:response regulator [Massilia sp. H-1]